MMPDNEAIEAQEVESTEQAQEQGEALAPSQPESMRDAIRRAVEEQQNKPPAEPTEEVVEEVSEEVVGEAAVEEEEEPSGQGEQELSDHDDEELGLEREDLSAPKLWSAEKKAKWDEIPEEYKALLKEDIKIRNRDYSKKTSRLSAERKEYKPINDLLSPYKGQLEKIGQTPASYIKSLVQIDSSMSVDPAGTILGLIEQFKITPEDLGFTESSEYDYDDDARRHIQEKRKLQAENSRFKATENMRKLEQEQQEIQRYEQMVQDFEEATDEEGEPLYPHFREEGVLADMIDIMNLEKTRRGVDLTLEEAYNRSQTVKALNLKAKRTVDQEAEKRRKIAEAKSKKGVISKPPAGQDTQKLSRRDAIRAGLQEQGLIGHS